jgi:hypothetical protein
MISTYTTTGFVHISIGSLTPWLGFNLPGRLKASPDRIELNRCCGRSFLFKQGELKGIKILRPAGIPTIQFMHATPGYPRFISFTTLWPPRVNAVLAELGRLKYPIQGDAIDGQSNP